MIVRYTATALAEITDVFSYIEARNPSAAIAVSAQVDHTISLLSRFPKMGRIKYRTDVRMLPVRHYPQYLLFYVIEDDELVILNLRHAARQRPRAEEE